MLRSGVAIGVLELSIAIGVSVQGLPASAGSISVPVAGLSCSATTAKSSNYASSTVTFWADLCQTQARVDRLQYSKPYSTYGSTGAKSSVRGEVRGNSYYAGSLARLSAKNGSSTSGWRSI